MVIRTTLAAIAIASAATFATTSSAAAGGRDRLHCPELHRLLSFSWLHHRRAERVAAPAKPAKKKAVAKRAAPKKVAAKPAPMKPLK
jgi:hypothetical protein